MQYSVKDGGAIDALIVQLEDEIATRWPAIFAAELKEPWSSV